MGTYLIKYRKHYLTGSRQTARRTIKAPDMPTAITYLQNSISSREMNVDISVLTAYAKMESGWVQMIDNSSDTEAPF